MSNEIKWGALWACWLGAGIAAEIIALRSKDDTAALSHHLRRHTHLLGKTHVGRVALLVGAAWLHRHLYRPMLEEARAISKIKGQPKTGVNDLGSKGEYTIAVLPTDGKRLRPSDLDSRTWVVRKPSRNRNRRPR